MTVKGIPNDRKYNSSDVLTYVVVDVHFMLYSAHKERLHVRARSPSLGNHLHCKAAYQMTACQRLRLRNIQTLEKLHIFRAGKGSKGCFSDMDNFSVSKRHPAQLSSARV